MTSGTRTRTGAAATTVLMLATAPTAALAVTPDKDHDGAQAVPRVRHLHTVTTTPAAGAFRCGSLLLTVTGGTETEVFDGLKTHGVTFIEIHRLWKHVKLHGSDHRTYAPTGSTREKVVLVEPDDDNPAWATEVIELRFHHRHVGSPGYLREVIKWRNGVRTDVVTGPCDFA
ncbi:MAG: hypothetical protein JWN91_4260 [Nocardioides sp.]|jgi:hypothetical protein|nr:hypothetical protein [Nocardioides sp.]